MHLVQSKRGVGAVDRCNHDDAGFPRRVGPNYDGVEGGRVPVKHRERLVRSHSREGIVTLTESATNITVVRTRARIRSGLVFNGV